MRWHKIAASVESLALAEKSTMAVEAGGKKLCLAKFNDELKACAYKCPHAGGHMAEGWVDAAGNIVCPLHRYRFSLANGRNTSGEGYYLKTYPVEVREDGVFAGIEEGGWFSW